MNLVSVNLAIDEFDYTRQGVERLSKAIRASIKVRGWTERKLRLEIQERSKNLKQPDLSLSASTVNRYVRTPPTIEHPQTKALKAFAPFVYQVVSIQGDDIQLDVSCTYEDNWRAFARIGTVDFENSAMLRTRKPPASDDNRNSGKESFMNQDDIGRGAGAVGRLIRAEMADRNLDPQTERDFREFVRFFPANHETEVEAVRAIVLGRVEYVNDDLIGFIALALRSFTENERYTTDLLLQINTVTSHRSNGNTRQTSH